MSNKPGGSLDLQICRVIVVKEIKQLFKRSFSDHWLVMKSPQKRTSGHLQNVLITSLNVLTT